MKQVDDISEELQAMGGYLLNTLSRQMPFSVPAGYFGTLAEEMTFLATLQDHAEPVPGWSRRLPYQVPAAYFDQFPAEVMALAQGEGNTDLPKATPFHVPGDYFEQFSANILSRVKEESISGALAVPEVPQKPKRVPLFRSMQLAASVALIIFAGFGLLRINNNMIPLNPAKTTVAAINFNGIPEEAIRDYVLQNIDDFDTELIVSSISAGSDSRLDAALGASNEEIEAYLNEDGWN